MYFLTDPLAGLEELMILFVIGIIAGFVLLIYVLYKLFNRVTPNSAVQPNKDVKENPGRTLLESVLIGLVIFLVIASIIATCLG